MGLAAWIIEERLTHPGGLPRYWRRLGAGFAAGVAGLILYLGVSAWHDRHFDRLPLERAVAAGIFCLRDSPWPI